MNSTETFDASTPREGDSKLDNGWKIAVGIGGMVVTAPVLALIFLLLIGSVLPLLLLGAPFVFHRAEQAPRPPVAPPQMREAPRTLPAPSPA